MMYQFKNLLIPLNLTAMDEPTISYASGISKMSESENAHFLHVKRPSEVPEEILKEYPLLNPTMKDRMKTMRESVKKGFHGHPDTKTVFEVDEGKPLEVLLEQVIEKDIDLVVVGRKTDATATRQLPMKLARRAPCSVLVVPEKSKYAIEKILVPLDFSEFCSNALELAVNLALANGISTIQGLHVFRLPIGYYKTGKTQKEFAEIMKKNAKKDYSRFIKGIDLKGIKIKPMFIQHDKPAQAIESIVEKDQIDMVVLGARGRDAGAGLLLGSVTENIILNTQVPIIAVKKKGTGLSFLEVLLKYL